MGDEIRTSWQNFTYRTYVAGYVLDTVQDHIIIITEDNVAVLSHQFHNENLMAYITKFVQVLQLKFYNTLQTRLAYRSDPGASDVLAEKHAKIRSSQRADPVFACKIDQRQGGAGGEKQTLLTICTFSGDQQFVTFRLGNFVNASPGEIFI